MKLLIVEDDDSTRLFLLFSLRKFGYEIFQAKNGLEAWDIFQKPDPPKLAIVDWVMPGMNGITLCKKIRDMEDIIQPFLIMLTAKDSEEDTLEGLRAGADEFLIKPINPSELKARVEVGHRLIKLQESLTQTIVNLESALNEVKTLQGFLSICAYCHKIRTDDSWEKIESYISDHTNVTFSHGVCPECVKNRIHPELEALKRSKLKLT